MKLNVKALLDDFNLGIIAYLKVAGGMNFLMYFPLAASAINYLQEKNVISESDRRECAIYFCGKFAAMLLPATVAQSVINQAIDLMVNQKETADALGEIIAGMKLTR